MRIERNRVNNIAAIHLIPVALDSHSCQPIGAYPSEGLGESNCCQSETSSMANLLNGTLQGLRRVPIRRPWRVPLSKFAIEEVSDWQQLAPLRQQWNDL